MFRRRFDDELRRIKLPDALSGLYSAFLMLAMRATLFLVKSCSLPC